MSTFFVNVFGAKNLKSGDKNSESDSYVVVETFAEEKLQNRLEDDDNFDDAVKNSNNPSFDGETGFETAGFSLKAEWIKVSMMDRDGVTAKDKKKDDILGSVWIEIPKTSKDKADYTLTDQSGNDAGSVSLSFTLPASQGTPQTEQSGTEEEIFYEWCKQNPVVRIAVHKMSESDLKRFMDVVDLLATNKDGRGTSEFFRLAGYHGYTATTYCHHKKESFPGWHRLYLHHFEITLRWFDKKNGGDGMIYLPYWDWQSEDRNDFSPNMKSIRIWWGSKFSKPDGGKITWKVLKKRRGKMVEVTKTEKINQNWLNLFPEEYDTKAMKKFATCKKYDDSKTFKKMNQKKVWDDANDSLTIQNKDHRSLCSTSGGTEVSVEVCHNDVHVAWGGAMANLTWAGFSIGFWLHHNNIDRLYEAGLKELRDRANEPSLPRRQMKTRFAKLVRQDPSKKNLYTAPVEPFNFGTKVMGGKDAEGLAVAIKTSHRMADTFDTQTLGYTFDILKQKESNLEMPPNLVIFDDMQITQFDGRVLDLNVFVCKKDEEKEFEEKLAKCSTVEEACELQNFAGSSSIFGRGSGCNNCKESENFDIIINISQAMVANAVGRKDLCVKSYAVDVTGEDEDDEEVDEEGNIMDLPIAKMVQASEYGFPQHRLVGTLFEQAEGGIQEGDSNGMDGEALQKYLASVGYYDGKVDNDIGPKTVDSIRRFQEGTGEVVDGVAGPKTKKLIKGRRCVNKDSQNQKDPWSDAARQGLLKKLEKDGKKVTYSIRARPLYLDHHDVDIVIDEAFTKWADASGLEFKQIRGPEDGGIVKADIELSWANENKSADNAMRFDGPGGVLGKGGDGFVVFDEFELWTTDVKQVSEIFDPSTWVDGKPAISLPYAALHEIGHALGLDHSNEVNHVMSPYYTPKQLNLSEQDKARIQELYGNDGGGSSPSTSTLPPTATMKQYLATHKIKDKLSNAVTQMLRDMPDDPDKWLIEHFTKNSKK